MTSFDYLIITIFFLSIIQFSLYQKRKSDNTNQSYFYYKPHLVINHSAETTDRVKISKYSVDKDLINLNEIIDSDVQYSFSSTADTLNILSFSFYEDGDCLNSIIDNQDCVNPLNPVISSGFNGELCTFDITIEDDYLNKKNSGTFLHANGEDLPW